MQDTAKTSVAALLGSASLIVMAAAAPAAADPAAEAYIERIEMRGDYMSGDKHNHTTCTDGTTSVRTKVDRSTLVYDLDWFAQTGHGGSGNRDCRFDDVASSALRSGVDPNTLLDGGNSRRDWDETIGLEAIHCDDIGDRMWRWQSLLEYAYPDTANAGKIADKTTWLGIESVSPGHEHTSMGILGNQFRTRGDAYASGQFEYLWDRADNDFSGGEDLDFENPANNGVPKIPNQPGDAPGGHPKAVASVAWLAQHHPEDSYFVPAHVERQGAFVPDGNRGFNPEHLRNFHNAGLLDPTDFRGESVGMGGKFAPGHQFQTDRGSYSSSRPTIGATTCGGAGCYGAAEMIAPATLYPDGEGGFSDLTRDDVNAKADAFDARFLTNPVTSPCDRGEPLSQSGFCEPGVSTF